MRRILKGVVMVDFMEEGMVLVVVWEEEEYPYITEAVEVIMDLEGGILEVVGPLVVVDMEGEECLEEVVVVVDMLGREGRGISSSMELLRG